MRDAVTDWQQLSALYEKADLLTVHDLQDWILSLRHQSHPLLEPLLQMLGARSEVQDNGFLAALPALPVDSKSAKAAPAAVDWQSGARIGPYRLERRLGAGGMAEVWRAERDDGAFQRTVAIKLLFRHVGGPQQQQSFAQRFSRERDILASLHHPNIAGLHDAGVSPSGQPWLALEYVEGRTLTDWCDGARLGVRARVELFLQVLLAVQHAHANLVIHRDLKPANILVTTAGQVRLLDFGIAKLMEAEGDVLADTEITRHAGRLMTVRYASPEQLTGQPLTTACDVYSLGVVLYELLCGQMPYEPRVDSPAQVEQAILEVEPRAPSRRALTSAAAAARGGSDGTALRRLLGNELDAVVLRALAKRPEQRYASVEALRVELERWLAGEPVEARAPTQAYRLRKFVGRHVFGVSLGSAAVLALFAVATAAVWLGLQARQESARATAARDFMMGMFKQADSDKSHGADMTARQLLDRGREDVLKRLKGQPELQADLLEGIAGIQVSMGEHTKADVTLSELAALNESAGHHEKAALAVAARAENALRLGDLNLARNLVLIVSAAKNRLQNQDELDVSLALTNGWIDYWEGHFERAKLNFRSGLARAEASKGASATRVFDTMIGIIQSDVSLRDFDSAIAVQEKMVQLQLSATDKTSRDVVELDVGYAELLYTAGRYRQVIERTRLAMPRCASMLGADNAMCRRLVLVDAGSKIRLGDLEATIAELPMLRSMSDDASSPSSQVSARLTLFRIHSQLGDLGKYADLASSIQSMALASVSNSLPTWQRVRVMQTLADDSIRRGKLPEAGRWLDSAQALGSTVSNLVPGYSPNATTKMYKGLLLLAENRPAEAIQMLKSAERDTAEALGGSHPAVLLVSLNQALAFAAGQQFDEALRVLDRATPQLKLALGEDAPTYRRVAALRTAILERASLPLLNLACQPTSMLPKVTSKECIGFFN